MKNALTIISLVVALIATLAFAAASAQAATPGPWKTDEQAARYLETQLPSWAGLNLHPAATTDADGFTWSAPKPGAYCINGAYSAFERKHHRRGYGERTDRHGEPRFRTFACSLDFDGHEFKLYVQTRRGPWSVRVDR